MDKMWKLRQKEKRIYVKEKYNKFISSDISFISTVPPLISTKNTDKA